MRQPEFYSAVFGIIRNEKGEILFQRRANTGYMDGWFQLPSGHIEGTETMIEATIREMKEEVNIDIVQAKVVYISHRVSTHRVYFDIYLDVLAYTGEIKNLEPEKCSELRWVDLKNGDISEIVSPNLEVFGAIGKGECFGEQR